VFYFYLICFSNRFKINTRIRKIWGYYFKVSVFMQSYFWNSNFFSLIFIIALLWHCSSLPCNDIQLGCCVRLCEHYVKYKCTNIKYAPAVKEVCCCRYEGLSAVDFVDAQVPLARTCRAASACCLRDSEEMHAVFFSKELSRGLFEMAHVQRSC
jgi:hypothetical protein